MNDNGPIQLMPWGLGNMLGLKGDVGILRSIRDILHPTIDMLSILAGKNAIENVQQTVAVNTVGSQVFSSLVVPANEAWLVRGVGASAVTGAAELLRFSVCGFNQLANQFRRVCPETASSLTDAAAAAACNTASDGLPFLLYGGEALRPTIHRITTAGTINLTVAASIYRFTG